MNYEDWDLLTHWKHNRIRQGEHHVMYLNDIVTIVYGREVESPMLPAYHLCSLSHTDSGSNWWWRHLDTVDNSELSVTRRWSPLTATCCWCRCCSISPVCAVYIFDLPCQHKHRGKLTSNRGVIVCILDFSVLLRHLLHQLSPCNPQLIAILSFCCICNRYTKLQTKNWRQSFSCIRSYFVVSLLTQPIQYVQAKPTELNRTMSFIHPKSETAAENWQKPKEIPAHEEKGTRPTTPPH